LLRASGSWWGASCGVMGRSEGGIGRELGWFVNGEGGCGIVGFGGYSVDGEG